MPSPAPVFDRLQYAKTEPVFAYWKRSKTGAGEGLGTRLLLLCMVEREDDSSGMCCVSILCPPDIHVYHNL